MSSVGQLVSTGPLLLALPVAAAAGAVTFLSPCVLPLVPGYLSFVTGMAGAGGTRQSPGTAIAPDDDLPRPGAPPSGVAIAAPPAAPAVVAVTTPAAPRSRVVAGTALFVLGFSLVFAVEGAAFGGFGHLLTGHAREL